MRLRARRGGVVRAKYADRSLRGRRGGSGEGKGSDWVSLDLYSGKFTFLIWSNLFCKS